MRFLVTLLMFLTLVAGCQPDPGAPIESTTNKSVEDEARVALRYDDMVDIGGRSLYATVRGIGPTVVLEPGAAGGGAYGAVVSRVAEFATVVMYDRAGVGRSDPPAADATVAEIAGDLHHLLTELPVTKPAVLVGWSLTGLSVLYHAANYHEDVAGVVVVDGTPYAGIFDTTDEGRAEVERLTRGSDVPRERKALMRWLHGRAGPAVDEELLGPYADSLLRIMETDRSGELQAIGRSAELTREVVENGRLPNVPIVVLSAEVRTGTPRERAEIVLANHQRIAKLAPRGRFILVEGGSHMMTLDRPDAIVGAIRDVVGQGF